MLKTIAFVTNQMSSDRLILAAAQIAAQTQTELMIVNVLDGEYELNPKIVDDQFNQSKRHRATMRLLFSEDKREAMREVLAHRDVRYIVTGMPGSHSSVVYSLWKEFGSKLFYTVDDDGALIEVATKVRSHTA